MRAPIQSKPREKLVESLIGVDERSRSKRAERILRMSQFEEGNSFIAHADTASILHETKACFVDGHFIAVQLLALSFCEHVLYERLSSRGFYKARATIKSMIDSATKHSVLSVDLLRELDRLRELRNPFVHREAGANSPGLGERVQLLKKHPRTILEADAKDSLAVMYGVCAAWLSGAEPFYREDVSQQAGPVKN
jgi:hypothetical protein